MVRVHDLSAALLVAVLAQYQPAGDCSPPRLADTTVGRWAVNIAVVESGGRDGFGFVVGWRDGQAWLAIPAHVVFGDVTTPTAAQITATRARLNIRLQGQREPLTLCSEGANQANPTPPERSLDLTFACVVWGGRPMFWPSLAAAETVAGTPVMLIAPTAGMTVEGNVAAVSADAVEAKELIGVAGMSGAPVASAAGIVGLYLGRGETGRVLTLSAIRRAAELVPAPWELVNHEFYDCRKSRRTCAAPSGPLAPTALLLSSADGKSYRLTAGECANVAEGKYQVTDPAGELLCQPAVVSVRSGAAPLVLPNRCSPNLSGSWTSADGHILVCIATLPMDDTARCEGFETMGWGNFRGTMTPRPGGWNLAGSFFDPVGNARSASGVFQWQRGQLSGEFRREGVASSRMELVKRNPQ